MAVLTNSNERENNIKEYYFKGNDLRRRQLGTYFVTLTRNVNSLDKYSCASSGQELRAKECVKDQKRNMKCITGRNITFI